MNIKQQLLNELDEYSLSVSKDSLIGFLVLSQDIKKGDVSLPCFVLAKNENKTPMEFAKLLCKQIEENVKNKKNSLISNVEVVGGYVNFFLNKQRVANTIVNEILQEKDSFGKPVTPIGETVFLDYCSVNLAKYMHIGHLKTTVIGAVLYNVYKFLGYNTVGINYIGDYGTPFGKIITAYKRWGSHDEIEKRGVDAIQDLYVKFNIECENDESLNEEARAWFHKVETNDDEGVKLYNWIIKKSVSEVERLCNILGVKFESWRGESYYNNKMEPVIQELEGKHLLKESMGAKIVDLEEYNLGVSLIQKSDGSSLYVTRDLAAVEDRYQNYHFNKGLYITGVQQKLHFQQLFKIVELMKKPYANNLVHISYGTYSLPTGKIGSRFGKQALVSDIIVLGENKAKEIMQNRGTKVNDVNDVATKIAVASMIYDVVKNERTKDSVFDINASVNFDGETAPYMQYTYARCCSIIEKTKELDNLKLENNENDLIDEDSYNLIKLLNKFPDSILEVSVKYEPCMLARNLMEICSALNKFYASTRIIDNNIVCEKRLNLIKCVKIVLESGLKLLNISPIEKM